MNRSLTFDQINDAESALAKSRAIVEVVSKSICADLGTTESSLYCDSLWAACDSLDQLKSLLVLATEDVQ